MLARASTNANNHSLPIDSTVKDGLSLFCILSPIASILSLDCHLKSRTHFFKLEWYLKGSAALFFFRSDKNNLVFDPSLQWNFYVRGSGHIFYRKKGRLLEPLSVQWKERKSGNFQRMMAFISLAIAITFSFEESFFMTASVAIPSKRVRSEEGEKIVRYYYRVVWVIRAQQCRLYFYRHKASWWSTQKILEPCSQSAAGVC